MEVKCRINGVDYDASLVEGHTFSEDYGETLDSGSIILAHQKQLTDLRPYDDVWLYTKDTTFPTTIRYNSRSFNITADYFDATSDNYCKISMNKSDFEDMLTYYYSEGTEGYFKPFIFDYEVVAPRGPFELVVIGEKVFIKAADFGMGKFEFNTTSQKYEAFIKGNTKYFFSVNTSDKQKFGLINYTVSMSYSNKTRQLQFSWSSALIALVKLLFTAENNHLKLVWEFDYTAIGESHSFYLKFYQTGVNAYKIQISTDSKFKDIYYEKDYKTNQRGPYSITINTVIPHGHGETKSYSRSFSLYKVNKDDLINSETQQGKFYKHLCIDQYGEEILNIEEGIYNYTLQLFSETKQLEIIPCSNSSVTEPLMLDKKITIYQYIAQFLYLNSPLIKIRAPWDDLSNPSNSWIYVRKFRLAPEIKEIFGEVYCQDFTLTGPTFREMLTELFKTLDYIPIVRDGVIYAYDKTKRRGWFHNCRTNEPNSYDFSELHEYVNKIVGSLSSDNYTDNLRRNHQNALAQFKSGRTIEYIGFRTQDNALLTLDNLEITTGFPIYKINSIKMCYYKNLYAYPKSDGEEMETKTFLCKQDITKLVKLESERRVLSQDVDDFNRKLSSFTKIEEMAQYKMCTVGYSIGSNKISGWSTKYTYLKGTWDVTATYIENMLRILDSLNVWGEGGLDYSNFGGLSNYYLVPASGSKIFSEGMNSLDFIAPSSYENAAKIKSIFFEIEYEPFYNGSIVVSKDGGRDCVSKIDNASTALSLLEKDGIAQKEKINSLGNKAFVFTARYTSLDQIQELGSVYDDGVNTDIIIYHKEYSVFDNVILCTYYGAKDYVLKQFYTSVMAKHRPYKLMSYEESIERSDVKKISLVLSKNKLYYEEPQNLDVCFSNFNYEGSEYGKIIRAILDVFSSSDGTWSTKRTNFEFFNNINYGLYSYDDSNYVSDLNVFVSGKSICINIKIPDNVSAGNYIEQLVPTTNVFDGNYLTQLGNFYNEGTGVTKITNKILSIITDRAAYVGSKQNLYLIADKDTGNGEIYNFCFGHRPRSEYIPSYALDSNEVNGYLEKVRHLPKIEDNLSVFDLTNRISFDILFKDNKDVLNPTLQIEFSSYGESDVFFSPMFCKLNDMLGIYPRANDAEMVSAVTPIYALYQSIINEKSALYNDTEIVIKDNREIVLPDSTLLVSNDFINEFLSNKSATTETLSALNGVELKWGFEDSFLNSSSSYEFRGQIYNTIHYGKSDLTIGVDSFISKMTYTITSATLNKETKQTSNGVIYKVPSITLHGNLKFWRKRFIVTKDDPFALENPDSDGDVSWCPGATYENDGAITFKDAIAYYYNTGSENGNNVFKMQQESLTPFMITNSSDLTEKLNVSYSFSILLSNGERKDIKTPLNSLGSNVNDWIIVGMLGQEYAYQKNGLDSYNEYVTSENKTYEEVTPRVSLCVYGYGELTQDIEYQEKKGPTRTNGVYNNDGYFDDKTVANLGPNQVYAKSSLFVADVFNVDEKGIIVDFSASEVQQNKDKIHSIQYWYLDEESKSYKFVFGVNLSDDDKDSTKNPSQKIRIYASLVRSKDTRVFDANGQPIGNIRNYKGKTGFESGQFFDSN